MRDPYNILGLERSATDEEVKKAYRKLAMEHHPDRTGGDDTKFKEIAEAYDILSDPKKKAQWQSQPRFSGGSFQFDEQVFEDFLKNHGFSDMFNNRYGYAQNGKGTNVNAQVQITLDEAYFGTRRELRLGMRTVAVTIQPGILSGQRLKLKGLGQKGMTEDLNGDLILTVVVMDHPDYMLDNRGLHKIQRVDVFDAMLGAKSSIEIFDKKINFNIPPGTQNGTTLRIQGKGFPIYNQPERYGDLYVNVLVELPKDLTEAETNLLKTVKDMIDGRKQTA
jgi:curved DNA-binding protein